MSEREFSIRLYAAFVTFLKTSLAYPYRFYTFLWENIIRKWLYVYAVILKELLHYICNTYMYTFKYVIFVFSVERLPLQPIIERVSMFPPVFCFFFGIVPASVPYFVFI